MSVGDNLLDYFSEEEINKKKKAYYPGSKKFSRVSFSSPKSEIYDLVEFHIKTEDKNYIIYAVMGDMHFENDFKGCMKKKKEIVSDIESSLTNFKKKSYESKYKMDDGKSIAEITDFRFVDESSIRVFCAKFSKISKTKRDLEDGLSVSISSKEINDWISNEAYK